MIKKKKKKKKKLQRIKLHKFLWNYKSHTQYLLFIQVRQTILYNLTKSTS
jgi:hypothetical protein